MICSLDTGVDSESQNDVSKTESRKKGTVRKEKNPEDDSESMESDTEEDSEEEEYHTTDLMYEIFSNKEFATLRQVYRIQVIPREWVIVPNEEKGINQYFQCVFL
ncbi:hypothetical protein PIB30_095024 [Stylosanthes scabra]|uniref:Uncharacterized protein n=1 Tax=Stylosanthes scabra TaxID=79078 RepID=A0ABU6VVD9_9FABA|nr:hypothetical protein [Stylosanthes scabra]